MNPASSENLDARFPELCLSPEQQALYNQLKMSGADVDEWLFGSDDPESVSAESSLMFPHTYTLGEECRVSKCELWPLIEQYYSQKGVSAWDSAVPCFITSSAYIAESYAEMILAFLKDHYQHLDLSEPVYILEMATGVGRFSYLLLWELQKKLACFSRFKALNIRYLMTDFTENNVNYWHQHEKLRPFMESGMLDFAVFRPEDDQEIQLLLSGQTLSPGKMKNPLIAIANYFFDSIRQDMFQVHNHQLQEGLVTLERTVNTQEQMDAFPEFDQIKTNYRYQDVSAENYYPEPEFNRLLTEYQREVKYGALIVPIGALRVLKNLQILSENNLVLLSSDKAFAEMAHMLLYRQHNFAVHGSFSYMVNYDAIGRMFKNQNGWYFFHNHWSSSLATVCCVSTRHTQERLERLQYFITQHLNVSNRITSTINANPDEASGMERLLAVIRLNLADPRAFCNAAPQLVEQLPNATIEQKHDLLMIMEMAWEKFYFYRGERNLTYWLAELYYQLGMQERCLQALDEALKGYTEYDWEYYYMKARSHERLNQWEQALDLYRKSVRLNPDFTNAHQALKNLETLAMKSGGTSPSTLSA